MTQERNWTMLKIITPYTTYKLIMSQKPQHNGNDLSLSLSLLVEHLKCSRLLPRGHIPAYIAFARLTIAKYKALGQEKKETGHLLSTTHSKIEMDTVYIDCVLFYMPLYCSRI